VLTIIIGFIIGFIMPMPPIPPCIVISYIAAGNGGGA
jgi:hypothetical protein